MAAPIETDPAAAPLAVVFAVAPVVADAVSEPSAVGTPAPSVAELRTLEIASATAGTTDVPGPVAPARAAVVVVLVLAALSVIAPAPISDAPAPMAARVSTSTMLSATEAPIPTDA